MIDTVLKSKTMKRIKAQSIHTTPFRNNYMVISDAGGYQAVLETTRTKKEAMNVKKRYSPEYSKKHIRVYPIKKTGKPHK